MHSINTQYKLHSSHVVSPNKVLKDSQWARWKQPPVFVRLEKRASDKSIHLDISLKCKTLTWGILKYIKWAKTGKDVEKVVLYLS